MLASTQEYITALRNGEYLRFLEWPSFVIFHYNKNPNAALGADALVPLLIFEWLIHGFTEDDAKQIAILYAAYGLESKPIRNDLEYSLITIYSTVVQCMLYSSHDTQQYFLNAKFSSSAQLEKLFQNHPLNHDVEVFKNKIIQQQDLFSTWVQAVDHKQMEEISIKIAEITGLRYLIEEYKSELEQYPLPEDGLKSTRLSVVARFLVYIQEQTALTPEVQEEIINYVNKIREYMPEEFEEKYLTKIAPFTEDSPWRFALHLGLSIFKFLKEPTSFNLLNQEKNEAQNKL